MQHDLSLRLCIIWRFCIFKRRSTNENFCNTWSQCDNFYSQIKMYRVGFLQLSDAIAIFDEEENRKQGKKKEGRFLKLERGTRRSTVPKATFRPRDVMVRNRRRSERKRLLINKKPAYLGVVFHADRIDYRSGPRRLRTPLSLPRAIFIPTPLIPSVRRTIIC